MWKFKKIKKVSFDDKLICPVCGERSISRKMKHPKLTGCQSNALTAPLRIIFVCQNSECSTYQKECWSGLDLCWYFYDDQDPELSGEALSFGGLMVIDRDSPPDMLLPNRIWKNWKEERAKYKNNKYIGCNWKSEFWRNYGLFKSYLFMLRLKLQKVGDTKAK